MVSAPSRVTCPHDRPRPLRHATGSGLELRHRTASKCRNSRPDPGLAVDCGAGEEAGHDGGEGLLVGPPVFGVLLEGSDSYAVAWAVYAALSGLVADGRS